MGKQYVQSVISQKPVKERIAECEKSRDVRVRERPAKISPSPRTLLSFPTSER